jgi:hypothetical protein
LNYKKRKIGGEKKEMNMLGRDEYQKLLDGGEKGEFMIGDPDTYTYRHRKFIYIYIYIHISILVEFAQY